MSEEQKTWCVYIHTNKTNKKVYVGLTCKKPKLRWRGGTNYKHNTYFDNAIMKVGWNNFEHIVFADKLSETEARQIEKMLIRIYNSNNREFGYNLSSGGESSRKGCRHSEATKRHLSEINLGDANPRRRAKRKPQIPNKPKLKPVRCIDLDMQFKSVQAAADYFGIEASNISKCCKGMRYSAGKMSWEYIQNGEP